MKHEIISVHRKAGLVDTVVATYGLIQITFEKNATGRLVQSKKSLAPAGKKLTSLSLPKDAYVALRQQVEAIFSSQNGHCKKSSELPALPPHPNTEKALKEFWPYLRRIKTCALEQRLSLAEAERKLFLDSIKDPAYRQTDFSYLHPQERVCFEALRQTGIKPLTHGVLGFSRTDRTEGQETKLQFKSADLNAAIRMQQHILDQYLGTVEDLAGETDRIDGLKSLAEQIHALALSWKSLIGSEAASSEELLGQVKGLAEQIAADLGRSRNPRKTQARGQAKHLTEPHDSLDRLNPGAQAARAVALLNRLAERLAEISLIAPIILKRKLALEAKKKNITDSFGEATARLEALAASWPKKPLTADDLRTQLGQVLFVLGQASILPYRAQADQAGFYLKAARRHADNRQLSADLLAKAVHIVADRPFD